MLLKKLILVFFALLPAALFAAPEKMRTVAITLFIDYPALTDAYAGIMDELKSNDYKEGENLKIIYNNAYGNILMAEQIAQDLVKAAPDIIIPISTPSAHAVVKADQTARIPVVFSHVTDPIAAQLVSSLTQPGGYVTGVFDLIPIPQQLDMIHSILPQIKTLGVIYNKAESNSVRIVEELKTYASSIKIIEAHANTIDGIVPATRSLVGKVDAIYIPSDNTVSSEIHFVLNTATQNRIPVFASDHDSVSRGALAALSYNSFEIGRMTGAMVVDILNGKNPGTIDVIKPAKVQLSINTDTAKTLNIKIPENLLKSAELISH